MFTNNDTDDETLFTFFASEEKREIKLRHMLYFPGFVVLLIRHSAVVLLQKSGTFV